MTFTAVDTDVIPPDIATELCRSIPDATAMFFSEDLGRIAEAKRTCSACPAIVSCLEGAMQRGEPCGVWGGQLFERGHIVHLKRRRGRPSKHPRPEDQVPDLPVPDHLLAYLGTRQRDRQLLAG